jgi:hypothetical protein
MAGSMSTAFKNALMNHALKGTAYTQPTHIYMGLTTSQNTDAAKGTEVTGGSYARVIVDTWHATAAGASYNESDVTFPTATADWGTVTGMILMDDLTAGNYLDWCNLAVNKTVNSGDIYKCLAGDYDISFAITP